MLSSTEIYKLLQRIVFEGTIYEACDMEGLSRQKLEMNMNDIELRSLILDMSMLRNAVQHEVENKS
jgi:hypothetical protein